MSSLDSDANPDRAGNAAVSPRDAATAILLAEADDGFEVFMVRRHDKSGFMAGAYVFPGGTLDDEDRADALALRCSGVDRAEAARRLGEDDPVRALGLHIAALRETFEEAGVLLAEAAPLAALDDARARVHRGGSFLSVVEELDLTLSIAALVPWSRWVTPEVEKRRYDARFFVARAPRDQSAEHDRIEVTAGAWMSPARALERYEAGEISLPPPTLRTIENLRRYATVDAVFAAAAERPRTIVQPELNMFGSTVALVLPGDPLHSERVPAIDGPSRFELRDGRFVSVDP